MMARISAEKENYRMSRDYLTRVFNIAWRIKNSFSEEAMLENYPGGKVDRVFQKEETSITVALSQ